MLTYNIADFGNVNFFTDFDIVVETDTTAAIGSSVCFTVSVTPTVGDNNPANNTLTFCSEVRSSYDPNEKEVYPANGVDTSGWLTYTINFQNTGTDTAQHIYVTDTLDSNLDEATFQLLAYSVQPQVQLNGNAVQFSFPNINLPDSNVNEPASHGYVQYKVKLKNTVGVGAQISNTAFIYFDFNAVVVGNTVTNQVQCTPDSSNITVTVCAGDTFYVGSIAHNVPGNYIDTLQNVNGCDSLVYLTLNDAPIIDPLITWDTICSGSGLYFNNQYHDTSGTYTAIFSSVLGCDSPVLLHLTVLPAAFDSITVTVCAGDTFYVGSIVHSVPGNYIDTLQNVNGCDSLVYLTLNDAPIIDPLVVWDTICRGDRYHINNQYFDTAGIYNVTLTSVFGCDSPITLHLAVTDVSYSITHQGSALVYTGNGSVRWKECGTGIIWQDTTNIFDPGVVSSFAAVITENNCTVTSPCYATGYNGIQNVNRNSVHLYPNPASDFVTVQIDENLIGSSVTITDITGRKILITNIEHRTSNIETSNFASGVYFVTIASEAGSITLKLVVSK